jgi:hypothetical protein
MSAGPPALGPPWPVVWSWNPAATSLTSSRPNAHFHQEQPGLIYIFLLHLYIVKHVSIF